MMQRERSDTCPFLKVAKSVTGQRITEPLLREGVVVVALPLSANELSQAFSRWFSRVTMVAVVLTACLFAVSGVSPVPAEAAVGELGPPPSDVEVRQALTWLYNNGKPPDADIEVAFPGPVIVGARPMMHPNPPPDPWCVRCGYPDQGASLMYPVMALVSVTTTQGLVASALPESSYRHVVTTTYNGTACRGQHKAEYCPAYYFYRDPEGRWRIAP